METVDATRLNVWRALSDLFLDTEPDEVTFKYIARIVLESGFSPSEIHSILWGEIFPVLKGNLESAAGVWAGWPDDWLLENIRVTSGTPAIQGNVEVIREIERCWARVAGHLPPEYA